MSTLLRRFGMWVLICALGAAPSFVMAANMGYDMPPMVFGVLVFAMGYTAVTATPVFLRLYGRPFIRRTLYIGYGTRMVLSLLMLAGALSAFTGTATFVGFAIVPDFFCGAASVAVTQTLGLEANPRVAGGFVPFIATFVTTLVQGTILNAIVFVFMAVVYGIQRAFCNLPPELGQRGFDVLAMPAIPVSAAGQPPVPSQTPDITS